MASKNTYTQGVQSPMGKAYMAAKNEQYGPMKSTTKPKYVVAKPKPKTKPKDKK